MKYGICVFNLEKAARLHQDPYEHPNPYYILARMVDVWAIGEIKPSPKDSDKYVTTYYELVDSPDLLHFAKWVMKREPLTPDEPMSFNPFYQQ